MYSTQYPHRSRPNPFAEADDSTASSSGGTEQPEQETTSVEVTEVDSGAAGKFWEQLRRPFPIGRGNYNEFFGPFFKGPNGELKALARILPTPKAIRRRLDEVCGPDGWSEEIDVLDSGLCQCRLTLHPESGRCASRTGLHRQSDASAAADRALAKAALKFGMCPQAAEHGEYVASVRIESEAEVDPFAGFPDAEHDPDENAPGSEDRSKAEND